MPPPHARTRLRDRAVAAFEDRYGFVRELGTGAHSVVVLLRDRNDASLSALKVAPLEDAAACSTLRDEYLVRIRVEHPRIPEVIDYGVEREHGFAFLLTDFADGADLTAALRRAGEGAAPALLDQALSLLEFVHRRGVVHGDLKPENLLVSVVSARASGPVLHLLDFGLARPIGEDESRAVGGTHAYMAPSVLAGEAPSPTSDLYSLGQTFETSLREADRRAPEEVARVLARMLRVDPDLAYPTAAAALDDLRRELGTAPAGELARRPLLHGRDEELKLFDGLLQDLRAGTLDTGLVVLEGEPGSGKSRLLHELLSRGRLAEVRVYRGRCRRGARALDAPLRLLSKALPAGTSLPTPGEPLSLGLLRDLVLALQHEAQEAPLLLVLDDLEAADEPTLAFLRVLARLAVPTGPVLVGALRTGEEGGGPVDVESRLGGEEPLEVVRLQPLNQHDVVGLLDSTLPRERLEGPKLHEWARLSGGNPGAALAGATHGIAFGAARSPAARLEELPPTERAVLEDLSILLTPVPIAFLASMGSGSSDELRGALERLVAGGWVDRDNFDGERRYRVPLTVVREAVLAGEPAERTRARHRRALSSWETWPQSADRTDELLAHHAVLARDVDRAAALGPSALRSLLDQGRLREVETTGVELLELLVAEGRVEAGAETANVVAEACIRGGRPETALPLLETAPEVDSPAERARRLRLLGSAAEARGDLDEARRVLGSAHESATPKIPAEERKRIAERLGAAFFHLGDVDRASTVWKEGLAVGDLASPGVVDGDLLNDLGVLERKRGDLGAARSYHERALAIRRGLGDLDGEARSLTNLANIAFQRAELREAENLYRDSLRLKQQVGTTAAQAIGLSNLALVAHARGDYAGAIEEFTESLRLRARTADRVGEALTRQNFADLLLEKGELRRVREELERSRALLEETGAITGRGVPLLVAEGGLALVLGELDRAERLSGEALAACHEGGRAANRADCMLLAGRILAERGDDTALDTLYSAVREYAAAGDRLGRFQARLALGRTALHAGSLGRAREALVAAEQLARTVDAPRLLSDARLELAELELAEGRTDAAARLLGQAERAADVGGRTETRRRCWTLRAELAARRGHESRALRWILQSAERLAAELEELPAGARVPAYLGTGDRRRTLRALASLADQPSGELPATAEELAARLDAVRARLAEPVNGDASRLRPEALERLLQISRTMNSIGRRKELLTYLRDRLEELFDAENSHVVLIGRDGSHQVLGNGSESAEGVVSRTLIDRVVAARRPELVGEVSSDPELSKRSSVRRLGIVSVLCAPLIVDDDVFGVIQFDHRNHPGPFTREDLGILELFAHQAATACRGLFLREALENALDKRHEAEGRLIAEERLKALGEMSAAMVHDFNNLLTSMIGIGELARRREAVPEQLRSDLDRIVAIGTRGAATIRRLQEFAGGPSGEDEPGAIDLARVAEEVLAQCRERFVDASEHDVWHLVLETEKVRTVYGRASELGNVLMNLILNAREAMPDGGALTLRVFELDGDVVVEVEDTGHGIDPEVRQRIFEPFFTTKPDGHGLGLSICWGIVRRMGGAIDARPGKAGGTVFRVSLPVAKDVLIPHRAPPTSRAKRPRRVLVVEDDPLVLEVLCEMVEDYGHSAVGRADPREALLLFDAEPFDVVLTDFGLPQMNGSELAREVRARRAGCPVVLLTGWNPGVDGGPTDAEDFALVLRKPVSPERLAEALEVEVAQTRP